MNPSDCLIYAGPLPSFDECLPEALRRWRDENGLTTRQAAALIGCGQTMVTAIERRDRFPSMKLSSKIAAALGVTPRALLGADPASLGRDLRHWRMRYDLSPGQAAELIGCSMSTVKSIESGHRTPSMPMLHCLAAAIASAPVMTDASK